MIDLLKIAAVLVASILLGNAFLDEFKKAKAAGKPWWAPYLSLPGLIVLAALLVPLVIWWLKR